MDILTRADRPMKRRELRDAFRARRIHIGGSDEDKNFGTKLWKAANLEGGRLTYDDKEGYWLDKQ